MARKGGVAFLSRTHATMPTAVIIIEAHVDAGDLGGIMAAIDEAVRLDGGPLLEAFDQSADVYMAAMQERYLEASGGDGTWEPLKPVTIRRKRRLPLGPGIAPEDVLQRYGDLYASLQRGHGNHVDERITQGLRRGTRDRRAARHHYGDPAHNLPARSVLVGPSPATLEQIATIQGEGLRRVIAGAAQR